jgi:putative transposase
LLPPESAVLAMLNWLGVKPSYLRPRLREVNAYAESLFHTAKYRPEFPVKAFETIGDARISLFQSRYEPGAP